jgi:hypothetical protein
MAAPQALVLSVGVVRLRRKSKWEPPPKDLRSLSLLSIISDEDEGGSAAADNKPSVSPLRARSGDILVAHPPPAQEPTQERASGTEGG